MKSGITLVLLNVTCADSIVSEILNGMKVAILGRGAFGIALESVIRENTPDVTLVGREETCEDVNVLVLAIPTEAITKALPFISFTDKKIIVNTSKGIEHASHRLPYDILEEIYPDGEYYSLMGPSFASEIIQKMPTSINLGYSENSVSKEEIKKLFQTDFFHVRLARGVEAMELFGAFKNIYAIGAGLATGVGYKVNTRISLTMLAIEEVTRLSRAMNISLPDDAIFGTLGDMMLSCSSEESRNFRFGKLISHMSVEKSLETINSTVEGYNSLFSVEFFEEKYQCPLPLARFIQEVVQKDSPSTAKEDFLSFFKKVE